MRYPTLELLLDMYQSTVWTFLILDFRSPAIQALERLLQMDSSSRGTSPWQSLVPDVEDVLESLNLNVLHRIILGLTSIALEVQLNCDGSLIDTADSRGWTPLHLAVVENNVEAVRILLEQGATAGKRSRGGDTPLHFAAKYGHVGCAEILLEGGALVNVAGRHEWSPLHCLALARKTWNSHALAELLISRGADVHAVDHLHRTPLHTASIFNRLQLASSLLVHGADMDTRDRDGVSPIMAGVKESSTTVFELLLERSAGLAAEDKSKRNIMHYMALYGNWHILSVLSQANLESFDAHAPDKDGNTPLDCFNHYRAKFVVRSAEGVTEEDEQRAFEALLARAGSSRVEEVDEEEEASARSPKKDNSTADDGHAEEDSPSDSDPDIPTQHADLDEDIFFDAEETLPSP